MIKADDLGKYQSLVDLLEGWSTAASKIGIKLTLVTVDIPGSGSVSLSLTEEAPNPAFWELS